MLEPTKEAVITKLGAIRDMDLAVQEKMLLREASTDGTARHFYNTSRMDLSKLGESGTADNLEAYIQSFSNDAREIFEHFKFSEFIQQLDDANLLYLVVKRFSNWDLSPEVISNHDMGIAFEELIRKFAESSNDTAGEHFTPRDIVRLTTALVFMEDDDVLTKEGVVRSIYDPTAGTGGFLSSGMEYLHELNPEARLAPFGQELNSESYAICKADMLIKGQDVSNIKLGNTLSDDQLPSDKFDYMLSNPPFGVDWKKVHRLYLAPDLQKPQYVKPPKGSEGERSRIKKGDILISITADLGSVTVADESLIGAYVSQHVCLARPGILLDSKWTGYFLKSDISQTQFEASGYGGTKIQLSLGDIRDIKITRPTTPRTTNHRRLPQPHLREDRPVDQ